MAEFYAWPQAARLMMTVLLALCVTVQALALALCHHRHARGRGRIVATALEICILVQVFICVLLHGQVLFNYETGLITPTGYVWIRYAVFGLAALVSLLVLLQTKAPWPLAVIAAGGLTLPAMETIGGNAFAFLYLAAILFYLARGAIVCALHYRGIRRGLSAFSIKNAIDSLQTGVLFGEEDGFILLSNIQMQRLMRATSGRVHRHGWTFLEQLASGDLELGSRIAALEGQIVCLLPDASAWMFTKTDLHIKKKRYVQLTAADITQRWNLTAQLKEQEALLQEKSIALKDAIANLHTLSRQRETQRVKMRAHDVLGQRLTLLLRGLRRETALDAETLRMVSQHLLDDLKTDDRESSPQEALHALRQAFTVLGVEIAVCGPLPCDPAKGRLFVDIIRESVTNAVRHGFATLISVEMTHKDGNHRLTVANNGHPPGGPIAEGGGIGGMRQKIAPHGGALDIATHPSFMLKVDLPGGTQDD